MSRAPVKTSPDAPTGIAVKYAMVETPPRTPANVFAWLPLVWTRVLFPGAAPAAEKLRWAPLMVLGLLSGLLLYPCLSFPLFEPDEGRYAQIPREMLMRGEWIVPTLHGEAYLDKPPLFYWLVMLSYSLFGYHDGAARLVPALAMHATVLSSYLLGRRIVGERSAFWGALLLTVSPIFLGVGRLLVLDGLLTLWVTLSLLAAYLAQAKDELSPHLWCVAALACGLGALTKGPVALVLLLVPLLLQRWLAPGAARIGKGAWLAFIGIIFAVNLPWYVLVCVRQPEFAGYFLWHHNVQRFVEPFDHLQPVWYYVPIVLFALVPAFLLARPLVRFLTTTVPHEAQRRCTGFGFLLLAGIWCVGFYSLAGSKLPTYILPALVPLCLAAGCFVARTAWSRSPMIWTLVTGCWLLLAASHLFVIPYYARRNSPLHPAESLQYCRDHPDEPVFCFPRSVNSAAFYLGRADFRTFRSKQVDDLITALNEQPRSVILFSHRHSEAALEQQLPPHLRLVERRPLGACALATLQLTLHNIQQPRESFQPIRTHVMVAPKWIEQSRRHAGAASRLVIVVAIITDE
jgi:hypothetical protein